MESNQFSQQYQQNKQQQQQQVNYNTTPAMNYETFPTKNFSLISELSPTQHLHNIMKQLEGYVWDDRQQKYIQVENVEPLMNKKGRNIFFHYASSTINQIVTMSNFRTEVIIIHNLTLMHVKDAIADFHFHWKDYGMKDKSNIKILTNNLLILTLASFYRAIGAGDRSAATRNISESINRLLKSDNEPNNPIKNQGFWPRRKT